MQAGRSSALSPDLIERAVRGRSLLRCNYRCYSRVIEPHVLADDGQMLVGFQISGGSESGTPLGWKEFRVPEILGATILLDGFKRRPLDLLVSSDFLARYLQAGALRAYDGGHAESARDWIAWSGALVALRSSMESVNANRTRLQLEVSRIRGDYADRVATFWSRRAG